VEDCPITGRPLYQLCDRRIHKALSVPRVLLLPDPVSMEIFSFLLFKRNSCFSNTFQNLSTNVPLLNTHSLLLLIDRINLVNSPKLVNLKCKIRSDFSGSIMLILEGLGGWVVLSKKGQCFFCILGGLIAFLVDPPGG
jgi:hypothetical protein